MKCVLGVLRGLINLLRVVRAGSKSGNGYGNGYGFWSDAGSKPFFYSSSMLSSNSEHAGIEQGVRGQDLGASELLSQFLAPANATAFAEVREKRKTHPLAPNYYSLTTCMGMIK
jgi:hypothetical protein